MWFSIYSLPTWQKYIFYLWLLITLVGCAIPVSNDYPAQPDQVERYRREMERWPYYGGSGYYYDHATPEEIWAERRAYEAEIRAREAERRAQEAEKRAREAEERKNQSGVNTSRQCTSQNPCKQFKTPR